MLLAAGLGTRLKPLTDLRPKPVVPVANRPLGAFAMDHLARVGVRSIVANTHPQPDLVEDILRRHCPEGVDLAFSREESLLGTGGGLKRARALFPDRSADIVVINADTLFAPNLSEAYQEHRRKGAVATMILRRVREPSRFGAIGIDSEGWVKTLLGAPHGSEVAEELMFTGVHILASEAFEAMPESGCVIRSAYRQWVDGGAPVLGVVDDSPWADLGTVSDYHRVNLELASGFFPWPGVEPVDGSLLEREPGEPSNAGMIRNSVVGANVDIAEGASIDACVVWPGSQITSSARHAVITPEHRIELS